MIHHGFTSQTRQFIGCISIRLRKDVGKHASAIRFSIRRYGNFAEHNFYHFLSSESSREQNQFISFDAGKMVLLQKKKNQEIYKLFPCGVLAPQKERARLLLKSAYHLLKRQKAKKFIVEIPLELKKELLSRMTNGIKASSYNYMLYWPMFNMRSWDPNLRGSKMKKLRNIRNRFYKKHSVIVKDCRDVSKDKLKGILQRWVKKRAVYEWIDEEYYLKLIESHFRGFPYAKAMYVDGKPVAINAGWNIPNSNNFYAAVGICDYSVKDLGEVANMDDLNRLKKAGYEYVDFGGSDKRLLKFKQKFKPQAIYKTYTFSLIRR